MRCLPIPPRRPITALIVVEMAFATNTKSEGTGATCAGKSVLRGIDHYDAKAALLKPRRMGIWRKNHPRPRNPSQKRPHHQQIRLLRNLKARQNLKIALLIRPLQRSLLRTIIHPHPATPSSQTPRAGVSANERPAGCCIGGIPRTVPVPAPSDEVEYHRQTPSQQMEECVCRLLPTICL